MANTTNYNWETPDDTDLVKDGAAAIRTLGSSIDTTTKALNPSTTLGDIEYRSSTANTNTRLAIGTTGQILSVVAGVPAWVANDVGDITEVQAGTGISVASGTGPVPVITNTVATAIDAKGDLIGGTGADTFARLAVGANDTVLTADSTTATGLKWAAPASGSTFVGCSLYDTNLTQSIANSTNVALTWNSEYFDTHGYHDNSTNTSRITIPTGKGGKYLLTGATHYSTGSTGYRAIKFKKNGGDFFDINYGAAGAYTGLPITAIVELSVGDYVELITVQNSGGSLDAYKYTATSYGWFAAQYLGA